MQGIFYIDLNIYIFKYTFKNILWLEKYLHIFLNILPNIYIFLYFEILKYI